MIFRNRLARRRDRDTRLLARYSEWTTFFAWWPVHIKRPDVQTSECARYFAPVGTDTVWLGFYRARYVRSLSYAGLSLSYEWQYAKMGLHAWLKEGEKSS